MGDCGKTPCTESRAARPAREEGAPLVADEGVNEGLDEIVEEDGPGAERAVSPARHRRDTEESGS